MAYDDLMRLTGAASGSPIEASAITADAVGTGSYKWVGRYRSGTAICRIAGAFDRTTGDETLTFTIREATDAAGTGATAIASSAAQTSTHRGNLTGSTADGVAAGTLPTGPVRVGFSTGSGGFVAAFLDVAGTTPSAAGVSVDVVMDSTAVRASGS